MVSTSLKLSICLLTAALSHSNGFSVSKTTSLTARFNPLVAPTTLDAKKKSRNSGGKGFGKVPEVEPSTRQPPKSPTPSTNNDEPVAGFSSIETTDPAAFSKPKLDLDPNLSSDERNKEILKQQFGLRSFEERKGDIIAAEKMAENRARFQKVKQMKDEDFDIFMIIPPPILRAIDFFLKTGLTITTILFVLSGFGITAEAWSVATNNPLPENVDSFIVNVIEPNFTPGLLVLLGFSVCLGIFATAQLGSGSSTYKEQ
jgi:hypothetical protein